MSHLGKLLITFGTILVVAGVALWGLGKAGFRGLPGDIHVESDRGTFYFPIVSCIILSMIVTLGMWLYRWFSRP